MVKQLNQKFHKCLEDCKKLNTPSVLQKVSAPAEKILYNYAIEMVSDDGMKVFTVHNDTKATLLVILSSVKKQPLMSSRIIWQIVSRGIRRLRFYFIVCLNRLIINTTEICCVNVSNLDSFIPTVLAVDLVLLSTLNSWGGHFSVCELKKILIRVDFSSFSVLVYSWNVSFA